MNKGNRKNQTTSYLVGDRTLYIVAAVGLVVGAMVFLLAYPRSSRVAFPEAIFNWVVVGAAAVAVLLVYLE